MNALKFCFLLSSLFLTAGVLGQGVSVDPDTSKLVSNHVADVLMVKGQVYKLKPGSDEPIKVAQNQRFNEGDEIQTAKSSYIKIKMVDDTVISLGPYSKLVFEKFKAKSKDDRKSVYGFLVGKMRAHFPRKAKPGDLVIKTKTVSLGIRGTKLLANLKPNSGGQLVTQFALLKGKVRVSNHITGKKTDLNPKDEYITINNGEKTNYGEGVVAMLDERHEKLLAAHMNEEEDYTPLLEYYEKGTLPKGSRSPSSINSNAGGSYGEAPYLDEQKGGSWKNKLKELNKRLENYSND